MVRYYTSRNTLKTLHWSTTLFETLCTCHKTLQSVAKRSLKTDFKRVIPGPSTDASGKYKIHRFYKSEGFGTKMVNKDVTFVTHCTVDQLYHLMEMSDRWDGPMSGIDFLKPQGRSLAVTFPKDR